MAQKEIGKQSVKFKNPPYIIGAASVVGEKEGNGPYGKYFDQILTDPKAGMKTWEEAEEHFQEIAARMAIKKRGKRVRYSLSDCR